MPRASKIHFLLLGCSAIAASIFFHGLTIYDLIPWHIGYSDILGFFEKASLPGLPYIDKPIEYPVITGLVIQLAGALGKTKIGYYLASSLMLGLAAFITTLLLVKLTPKNQEKNLYIYWIFAPSFLFFSIYNWDIIAVLFSLAAFLAMKKDKDLLAAFFLALGFASKFYPVIYFLPLILKLWKNHRFKKIGGVIGIFLVTAGVINLPFILANFDGWSFFYHLNQLRGPNLDSMWGIVSLLFRKLTVSEINITSLVCFITGAWLLTKRLKDFGTLELSFGLTLLFLIFNKVFSPQYILWLLPFFVILNPPPKFLFYTLELTNIAALFSLLAFFFQGQLVSYLYMNTIAVLIRFLCLLAVLMLFIKKYPRLAAKKKTQ